MIKLIPSRVFLLRVFVVNAALLSLCISSNVGPQFLPWPALDSPTSANLLAEHQEVIVSSSNESISFRVPMMVQAQKRADRQLRSGSALLTTGIYVLPADVGRLPTEIMAPESLSTFPITLEPPGRAPPDSV